MTGDVAGSSASEGIDPDLPTIARAAALLDAGRAEDARRLIGPVLTRLPDDPSALEVGAASLLACGEAAEAVVLLEQRLAVGGGGDSAPWLLLASALLHCDRPADAVQAARRGVEADPREWSAHANLALIAAEAAPKDPLGVRSAREAVRLAPNEPLAHFAHGNVMLGRRRPRRAAASFRECLRLDPQHVEARHNLAVADLGSLRHSAAAASFAAQSAEQPGSDVVAHNLRVSVGQIVTVSHLIVFVGVVAAGLLVSRTRVPGVPAGAGADLDPIRPLLFGIAGVVVLLVAVHGVRVLRQLGVRAAGIARLTLRQDRLLVVWIGIVGLSLLLLTAAPLLPGLLVGAVLSLGKNLGGVGAVLWLVRMRRLRRTMPSDTVL